MAATVLPGDALPADLDPRLRARAAAAAQWLQRQRADGRRVLVVHHIDADGVTAGAIAAATLDRLGLAATLHPVKSLDDAHLAGIRAAIGGPPGHGSPTSPVAADRSRSTPSWALWFCDLGSTAYSHFPDVPRLVCDHHELVRDGHEEDFPHVNPLLDGLPGDSVSGAGCAYLVAAAAHPDNLALLPLALVGATADLQDRRGGLHGANAALVRLGQAAGLVATKRDLAWFGTQTRPLGKFLRLAREPAVPGATGRQAKEFLASAACAGADPDAPWCRQPADVRMRIRSALVERLLDCGLAEQAGALMRDLVTFPAEREGSPTHEAQEFGTLLNSTARYGRPDVGIAVARGDRGPALDEALGLLDGHRKHLVGALDHLRTRRIHDTGVVQWVHLEDAVLDTVVGIVAGMALDSLGLRRDRPLLAFANTPDGKTKVSARAPHELRSRGIDLAAALRDAAARVGGQGGGHQGAAGATVPRGSERAFVVHVETVVAAQLGLGAGLSLVETTA